MTNLLASATSTAWHVIESRPARALMSRLAHLLDSETSQLSMPTLEELVPLRQLVAEARDLVAQVKADVDGSAATSRREEEKLLAYARRYEGILVDALSRFDMPSTWWERLAVVHEMNKQLQALLGEREPAH